MNQIIVVGDIFESNGHDSMAGRVYSPQGLCPSLGASHFQQVKYILEKNNLTDMEKNKCLTEQNRTEQNRTEQLPNPSSNEGRSDRVYATRNSRFGLSQQRNTKGKGTGEGADMSYSDNGEYP